MNGCHRAAGPFEDTARGHRTRLMTPPDIFKVLTTQPQSAFVLYSIVDVELGGWA